MLNKLNQLNKMKGMSFISLRMLMAIYELGPMTNKRLALELGAGDRTVIYLKANAVQNNLLVRVTVENKSQRVHDVHPDVKDILDREDDA